MRKWLPKTRRIWALYYKEQLIADGTLAEIAESTGRKYETLYWMTMPVARRRSEQHKDAKWFLVDLSE